MAATARGLERTKARRSLFLALELGESTWKLAFTPGLDQKPRERTIAARDREALRAEVAGARRRFGLPARAPVVSCYEAGREGFWLHRFLVAEGIENRVVDAASIEVNRRSRHVKTDRMDVHRLLRLLVRESLGEEHVWAVVRVPSPEEEDRRHLHRELVAAKRDRTRVTNRIQGLLANHGLRIEWRRPLGPQLDALRLWDGAHLPPGLRARIEREWARVELLNRQIRALEAERREAIRTGRDRAMAQVRQLVALQGIGSNSAWLYVMEFFGWRRFRNRKQVGSLAGLTPTPHQSGEESREQGIGRDGNRYVRGMAIEIAWGWLRFQPRSALTRWYQRRFGRGSSRLRRIGIVALARKLLIALWRFLETGVMPDGAVLAPAYRVR
jgi:transposase